MILQEKIQKKAEGYGKLAPAFLEGARFALENQWISVKDDLPCNHEELMKTWSFIEYEKETLPVFIRDKRGNMNIDCMIYDNNKWNWEYYFPKYWMPIPELSKE